MRLLLISNSTNAGEEYLDYPKMEIKKFLGEKKITGLFFPYAGVTISFDEWDGSIFDASAYLEFLFHKNFGIGAGYLYFDADVEREREKRIGQLDYQYSGVQIYGIWHF